MKITKFKSFGIYNVSDLAYLKDLHDVDSQVQYSGTRNYAAKPFLGISLIGGYNYLIPLSSPKQNHSALNIEGTSHFLIYEEVDSLYTRKHQDVFKKLNDKELKILAILDVCKMIPVPQKFCSRIDFRDRSKKYNNLLQKEYRFCRSIQDKIYNTANSVYSRQKNSGIIIQCCCNFNALEKVCTAA